jgi:2-dehydro-3-deoxy-D-gluconate 5-dehydrogenase
MTALYSLTSFGFAGPDAPCKLCDMLAAKIG